MGTRRRALAGVVAVLMATLPGPVAGHPDVPDPERVESLRAEARTAARRLDAARARLDAVTAAYEAARGALEQATARLEAARARLKEVAERLAEARAQLNDRAEAMYRGGRVTLVDALLEVRSFADFMRASTLVGAVLRQDDAVVERVESLVAEAEAAKEEVAATTEEHRRRVSATEARQAEMMQQMRAVAALLERVRSDLGAELGKFRFPVRPPYSYVDTYGAPRMTGTPYAHSHQGIDIFAPEGTPVVAVVGGTLNRVGWNTLGGWRLWLDGPEGHSYYYAHLSGFAPAAANGATVSPGTVLGYVGDTGNARGTPPHLHFEIHTPSGAATNPYPTLREAERAWARI